MANLQNNVFASAAYQLSSLQAQNEAERIYQAALKEVRNRPEFKKLDPDLVDRINTARDLEALVKIFKDERAHSRFWKHDDRSSRWRMAGSVHKDVMRFKDALDKIVQMNTTIALPIWSAACFVAIIVGEVLAINEYLMSFEDCLRNSLNRFHHYYLPGSSFDTPLRESLQRFYAVIIRFCLESSVLLTSSPKGTARRIILGRVKPQYEALIKELEAAVDSVDKHAVSETHRDVKLLLLQPSTQNTTSTTSVLGASVITNKLIGVPGLLSPNFYGRNTYLGQIDRLLQSSSQLSPTTVAIWGPPGIGKSQILLKYIDDSHHQVEGMKPYTCTLWVRSDSKDTILLQYRNFAQVLGLCERAVEIYNDDMILEKLKNWFATNQNWLLVFDNVVDVNAVKQLTPLAGQGSILCSTRDEVTATTLAGDERSIEIKLLAPVDAAELVLRLSRNQDNLSIRDSGVANQVADFAGHLPIAIEQFVKLASLMQQSLHAMLQTVNSRRDLLSQQHPASLHDRNLSTGALLMTALEVLSTRNFEAVTLFKSLVYLQVSFIPDQMLHLGAAELAEYFERRDTYDRGILRHPNGSPLPEEQPFRLDDYDPFKLSDWAKLLRIGVPKKKYLYPRLPRVDSASDQALQQYWTSQQALRNVLTNPVQFNVAVNELVRAGLIRRLTNDNAIWIHDLFADMTKAIIEQESEVVGKRLAQLACTLVYLAFPVPERTHSDEMITRCFKYLPHARSALQQLIECGLYNDFTIGAELSHIIASTIHLRGRMYQSPKSADRDYGDLDEAIRYYKLAYSAYLKAWRRLMAFPNMNEEKLLLAVFAEYLCEERWHRYLPSRHLFGYSRYGSSAATRCLNTALKLGRLLTDNNQLDDALVFAKVACTGIEKMYGLNHDETRYALGELFEIYETKGENELAYQIACKRMDSMCQQNKQDGIPRGLSGTEGASLGMQLGRTSEKLDRLTEACKWYQVALAIIQDRYGENDKTTSQGMLALGEVYGKMGRWNESAFWIAKAITNAEVGALGMFFKTSRWCWDVLDKLDGAIGKVETWEDEGVKSFVLKTAKFERMFADTADELNEVRWEVWDEEEEHKVRAQMQTIHDELKAKEKRRELWEKREKEWLRVGRYNDPDWKREYGL